MATPPSIAYLILAHSDPQHLGRLLRRLQAPFAHFVIHLDAKADLSAFRQVVGNMPHVTFCSSRIDVRWAGFSMVRATLSLIEEALRLPAEVERFVLLSGADYPLVPNHQIQARFAASPRAEFIRGFVVKGSHPSQEWKVRGWHLRDWANRGHALRKPLAAIERLVRLFPRATLRRRRVIIGSQWWALTRACAAYCLEQAQTDAALLRDFAATYAPDEMFFQTLVHNSPFANAAGEVECYDPSVVRNRDLRAYANLHFLNGSNIRTAQEAEAIFTNPEGLLFARKFESSASQEALEALDRLIDGL